MHMLIGVMEEDGWHEDENKLLSTEDTSTLRGLIKILTGHLGKDNLITALVAEGLSIDPQCEDALVDEVHKSEETIGDLRDQLSALRAEYSALYSDMSSVQDSAVQKEAGYRKTAESYAGLLQSLKDGKPVEDDSFVKFTDNALSAEVNRLTEEVDINKITDKLGDGMSRTPDGKPVENPIDIKDHKENKTGEIALTDAEKRAIEIRYGEILFKHGLAAASQYIKNTKTGLANKTK